MICSFLLDTDDSPDFPESSQTALGRTLAAYPMIAAKSCSLIRQHYALSRTAPVKAVSAQNGAVLIPWPSEADAARGFDLWKTLFFSGARFIQKDLQDAQDKLELLCVLTANAPSATAALISSGIESLLDRSELDSALSVSPAPRLPPFSAMRETAEGLLDPFGSGSIEIGSIVWRPDWGVQILKPRCLQAPSGPSPFPWLGHKVLALKQEAPGPVDYQWQLPAAEAWLKKHGATDAAPARELKPQPLPRPKRR